MKDITTSETNAREYFLIKNTSDNPHMISILFYKLTALNAMLYRKGVFYLEINLTIDQKKYSFSEKHVTPELIELIEAVYTAGKTPGHELTLIIDYCLHDKEDIYYRQACPHSTLKEFSNEIYYNKVKNDIFYYTYIEHPSLKDAGLLAAYGILNHQEFHGFVNFKKLTCAPECAHWCSQRASLVCDTGEKDFSCLTKEEKDFLKKCQDDISAYCTNCRFSYENNQLTFNLTNLVLRNDKNVKDFSHTLKKLCSLFKGSQMTVEFLELSAKSPLIIKMTVDCNDITFYEKRISAIPIEKGDAYQFASEPFA